MSSEHLTEQHNRNQDRELENRTEKLPNGLRKFIRRLKQDGKLEEAYEVRKRALRDKANYKGRNLNEQLLFDTATVLQSTDPTEQVESAFRATWIVSLEEGVTREERKAELSDVYKNFPEAEEHLSSVAPRIAAEVADLAKRSSS